MSGGWISTGHAWSYDAERYQRIAAARVSEQQAMLAYLELCAHDPTTADSPACRMAFITDQLDDPHTARCGRCDLCAGAWYPTEIAVSGLASAQAGLDRVGVDIPARAQWPSGLSSLGLSLRGKLSPAELVEPGRVIARLSDLGWGGPLRDFFHRATANDGSAEPAETDLPPALAEAMIRVLAGWSWAERPVAVCAVPSVSRPRLSSAVATGIARAGGLQLLDPLQLHPSAAALRGSTNSAYRVRDLIDRFVVGDGLRTQLAGLDGGVLLVDDLIDSRWTMTIAGRQLRRAGASAVLPVALASVG